MENTPFNVLSVKKAVSVIVPTYNGAHKLPALMNSLTAQTILPDEIIFVVDGSTDQTINILSDYQSNMPSLKIITIPNSGRSVVRNTGASVASGDILVFFDDDMVPDPSCIQRHILHHQEIYKSILVGAQIDNVKKTDLQIYKASLTIHWQQSVTISGKKELPKDNLYLTSAHFSVHRSDFIELGGFDISLRDAEDYDLAVRAHLKLFRLYFDPEIVAYHMDVITGVSYIRRLREYRKAHLNLYARKKDQFEGFKRAYDYFPRFPKNLLFRFFAFKWWINWLDRSDFKDFLPRRIRFLLYDLIITANAVFYPDAVELD